MYDKMLQCLLFQRESEGDIEDFLKASLMAEEKVSKSYWLKSL